MKRRGLTPEEDALWRRTTRDVSPLVPERRSPSPGAPPDAVTRRLKEDAAGMGGATAGRAYGGAPGLQTGRPSRREADGASVVGAGDPKLDRRVARRRLAIDRRIDLHGMTEVVAQVALKAFLEAARRDGCRCVLVITGKGGGPKSRGVLHSRFSDWVDGPALKAMIARVAPAHRKDGGAGAWYVFLKARGQKRG